MVGSDPQVICAWGMHGLRASAAGRVVVIVDVLSFSTSVSIAVSNGAAIFPSLADAEDAVVASERGRGEFSLSPASLLKIPEGYRLVLPSLNGSTLTNAARELNATAVVIGCIRNAAAVAGWIGGRPAAVIAAGERWEDGPIRFAIEDWLGVGAIISHLPGSRSPEAAAAVAAFERVPLREALMDCDSGRELIDRGYPDDVELASELDADEVVPLLTGNAITLARS